MICLKTLLMQIKVYLKANVLKIKVKIIPKKIHKAIQKKIQKRILGKVP